MKRTLHVGLEYLWNGETQLVGCTDVGWGGDIDDHKPTLGYIFSIGNGPISWQSKKQQMVSLSSIATKYQGLFIGVREVVWLQRLLDVLAV